MNDTVYEIRIHGNGNVVAHYKCALPDIIEHNGLKEDYRLSDTAQFNHNDIETGITGEVIDINIEDMIYLSSGKCNFRDRTNFLIVSSPQLVTPIYDCGNGKVIILYIRLKRQGIGGTIDKAAAKNREVDPHYEFADYSEDYAFEAINAVLYQLPTSQLFQTLKYNVNNTIGDSLRCALDNKELRWRDEYTPRVEEGELYTSLMQYAHGMSLFGSEEYSNILLPVVDGYGNLIGQDRSLSENDYSYFKILNIDGLKGAGVPMRGIEDNLADIRSFTDFILTTGNLDMSMFELVRFGNYIVLPVNLCDTDRAQELLNMVLDFYKSQTTVFNNIAILIQARQIQDKECLDLIDEWAEKMVRRTCYIILTDKPYSDFNSIREIDIVTRITLNCLPSEYKGKHGTRLPFVETMLFSLIFAYPDSHTSMECITNRQAFELALSLLEKKGKEIC